VLVVPLACDSSSDGGAGEVAADSSHVSAFCDAQCDYQQRCDDEETDGCLSRCRTRLGEPSALSQRALEVYVDCMSEPVCVDDDVCEDRVLERSPAIEREVLDCLAFARSCPFEADLSTCLRIALLTPEVRAQLAPCYVGSTCTADAWYDCIGSEYSG
jgi:hypothetical protein